MDTATVLWRRAFLSWILRSNYGIVAFMFYIHRYRKACIYFLFMRQCDGWKVICLTLGAEIRKRPWLVTNGDLETWSLESPLHHHRHATEQVSHFPQKFPFVSTPRLCLFLAKRNLQPNYFNLHLNSQRNSLLLIL